MDNATAQNRINALSIWHGDITTAPLGGGRTNLNFTVKDDTGHYVVRFGEDLPEHQLLRFNELAASRAAHAAGLSPAVVHVEDGLTVIDYIESKTLGESDVGSPEMLARIIPLLHRCHREIPKHYRGPALIFWVFHVIRDYAATLRDMGSAYVTELGQYLQICEVMEAAAGPFDIVFGHNDLMAANFLDDGKRLWLIDWDYAGFNSPLFDLGGLASNNSLTEAQEQNMLELYFEGPVSDGLLHRYHAMKCASLLRECMWSMVSELTSKLKIDYAAYTVENLGRFNRAYDTFKQS
ncbi:phosphotransferase [Profundibacter sp.]